MKELDGTLVIDISSEVDSAENVHHIKLVKDDRTFDVSRRNYIIENPNPIEGLGWVIKGNTKEFDIVDDKTQEVVAHATKDPDGRFTYDLEVADEAQILASVAIVMCITQMLRKMTTKMMAQYVGSGW